MTLEKLPDLPCVFEGKQFVDDRGSVSFVNEFNPYRCGAQRFYTVRNIRSGYIRAFHGHYREGKFIHVVSGSALIKVISVSQVDQWRDSKKKRNVDVDFSSYVLCGWQPKVLWIPPGFFNGFKSLKEDTDIMFFSTSTLEESQGDDIRLDWDAFGDHIWEESFR